FLKDKPSRSRVMRPRERTKPFFERRVGELVLESLPFRPLILSRRRQNARQQVDYKMALKCVRCNEMLLRMHLGAWCFHLAQIFGVEKYSFQWFWSRSGSFTGRCPSNSHF